MIEQSRVAVLPPKLRVGQTAHKPPKLIFHNSTLLILEAYNISLARFMIILTDSASAKYARLLLLSDCQSCSVVERWLGRLTRREGGSILLTRAVKTDNDITNSTDIDFSSKEFLFSREALWCQAFFKIICVQCQISAVMD